MYAKTVIFGIIATVIVLFVIIFIIVLGDKEAELGTLERVEDGEVLVNPSANTVAPKDSGELVKLFNIRPGEVGRGATVSQIEGGGLFGINPVGLGGGLFGINPVGLGAGTSLPTGAFRSLETSLVNRFSNFNRSEFNFPIYEGVIRNRNVVTPTVSVVSVTTTQLQNQTIPPTVYFFNRQNNTPTGGVRVVRGATNAGLSITFSRDDSTVVVGNWSLGDVYIYTNVDFNSFNNRVLRTISESRGFGASVAISGDGRVLAVGDDYAESVFLYRKNGENNFERYTTIISPDGGRRNGGGFGSAVAISDDASSIVVGNPSLRKTYYYREVGGVYGLFVTKRETIEKFGATVAIANDKSWTVGTTSNGFLYSYEQNGRFENDIVLDENYRAITIPNDNTLVVSEKTRERVSVYEDGWKTGTLTLSRAITKPQELVGKRSIFGYDIASSDGTIAVVNSELYRQGDPVGSGDPINSSVGSIALPGGGSTYIFSDNLGTLGGGGSGGSGGSSFAGILAALGAGLFACLGAEFIPVSPLSVPTIDKSQRLKECSLDGIARSLATQAVHSLLESYINWAKEGFHGKPLFVEDPSAFWRQQADFAVGRVLEKYLPFFCDNRFRLILEVQLGLSVDVESQVPSCTATEWIENIKNPEIGFDIRESDNTRATLSVNNRDIFSSGNLFKPLILTPSSTERLLNTIFEADRARTAIEGDRLPSAREQVGGGSGTVLGAHDLEINNEACDGVFDFVSCITQPVIYADSDIVRDTFTFSTQLPVEQISEADEFGEVLEGLINATISGVFKNFFRGGIQGVDTKTSRRYVERNVSKRSAKGESLYKSFVLNDNGTPFGYADVAWRTIALQDTLYFARQVLDDVQPTVLNSGHYFVKAPQVSNSSYVVYSEVNGNRLKRLTEGVSSLSNLYATLNTILSDRIRTCEIQNTNNRGGRIVTIRERNIFCYTDASALVDSTDFSSIQQQTEIFETYRREYFDTLTAYLYLRGTVSELQKGVYKNATNKNVLQARAELLNKNSISTTQILEPYIIEDAIIKKFKDRSAPTYRSCSSTSSNALVFGSGSFCVTNRTLATLDNRVADGSDARLIAKSLVEIIYTLNVERILSIPTRAPIDVQFNQNTLSLTPFGQGYNRDQAKSFAQRFSNDEAAAENFVATSLTPSRAGSVYIQSLSQRTNRKLESDFLEFRRGLPSDLCTPTTC